MKLTAEDQAKLAQLIDQTCREQPAVKAPRALRSRVFAALERRAALPWWRKSFVNWPMPMRIVFLLAAIGVVPATLNMMMWFNNQLAVAQPVSRSLSWLQNASAFISFLQSLSDYVGATLLHRIPVSMLYGAALGMLILYGLLVGLSAAAYRPLYATR